MSDRLSQIRNDCCDVSAQHAGNTAATYLAQIVEPRCESEIEKMMAAALVTQPLIINGVMLYSQAIVNMVSVGRWKEALPSLVSASLMKRGAYIFLQQPIGNYRADFVVVGVRSLESKPIAIVVECDGHDFHERTKQQAVRDKRRDRSMIAQGYRVFRFAGSEIWKNPVACAVEVMDFLSAEVSIGEQSNG